MAQSDSGIVKSGGEDLADVGAGGEVLMRGRWVPRASLFFLGLILLMLIQFAALRAGLIFRNLHSAAGISWRQILSSFLVGVRFDLAITCYILLPFIIVGHLPGVGLAAARRGRRIFYWIFLLVMSALTLLLIAEYEFFREFQTRYNQLALDYLDHSGTVSRMLWYNYPVVRYLLAWVVFMIPLALGTRYLLRACFGTGSEDGWRQAVALVIILPLTVFGMRGGFQPEPLRWGDAYRSGNEFVDQMSLNGVFTLGVSIRDKLQNHNASRAWKRINIDDARPVVREMILGPGDRLLDSDNRTVLRVSGRSSQRAVQLKKSARPVNVMLVIMESFSARYSGAAGSPEEFEPEFTKLAKEGVLFDRNFSSGTHTHQGVFSSILGFPNLPGYETLMQNMVSNQPFATLPTLFKQAGYQTLFIYNGDFSWDNMEGFFRKQGVDRFIGKDDYVRPGYRDKVWGVSDMDVFNRANEEFARMDKAGPFFSVLLTLSNHAPFDLPEPLAFPRTTNMGELNGRMNGIRYADWAVGRFIEEAKKLEYFDRTLFVFVGDHGFHVPPVMTNIHLLFHHVPLLFYAPKLLDHGGAVFHQASSQVNIAPTILGLLDMRPPQAFWGRDLFRVEYEDENFAIFKASGGGKDVAMVRGDKVLVIDEKNKPRLWKYDLGFPPSLTPYEDTATKDRMERELRAFVGAGLYDLTNHRAGLASGKD